MWMPLLALTALAMLPAAYGQACDDGWTLYGGHCYKIFGDRTPTIAAAREACESNAAKLLQIEDSAENDFVEQFLDESYEESTADFVLSSETDIWLGSSRPDTDSEFTWSSGEALGFTDWKSGQPGPTRGRHDALCMQTYRNLEDNWRWYVANCDGIETDNAYVCEKDPCDPNPCRNRGTCDLGVCTCYSDAFSGDKCEIWDSCDPAAQPCHNGGVCADGGCHCADGFAGENCETNILLQVCPEGWSLYAGHCYKIFPTRTPQVWPAIADCRSQGAELVQVESEEENTFLNSILDVAYEDGTLSSGTDIWIGAIRPDTDIDFVWLNGQSLTFTDWRSGYPKANFGGPALCAITYKNNEPVWQWYSGNCDGGDADNAYTCEMDASLECPDGWSLYMGNCYKVYGEASTYVEAIASCQSEGAGLVQVETEAENNFLEQLLDVAYSDGTFPEETDSFLGATRIDTDSPFVWNNGHAVEFTDWKSGQPTPNQPRNHEALCIQTYRNLEVIWRWYVASCGEAESDNAYTCEKPASQRLPGTGFEVNVDYLGDDINGCSMITDSASQCQAECKATVGCSHFTYISSDFTRDVARAGQCCLKNGQGTRNVDIPQSAGLISGAANNPTWALVYRHDMSGGYFGATDNIITGVNKDDPNALLYSRLDELDTLNANGPYHFKFVDAAGPIVEWYQTSNPTTASDIEGYVPIAVPDPETFPDQAYNGDFGGIGLNDENKRNYALIDSSPHHTHWWMSLGNLQPWNGLIPGWAGSGTSRVELYVQSGIPEPVWWPEDDWLNRDNPGSTGDWEVCNKRLYSKDRSCPGDFQGCRFSQIQIRVVGTETIYTTAEEVFAGTGDNVFLRDDGFVCRMDEQTDGTCEDYEIKVACISDCRVENDFDYTGNDIDHVRSVTSWQECANLCLSLEGCQAYTYNLNNLKCWRKRNAAGRRQIASGVAISGYPCPMEEEPTWALVYRHDKTGGYFGDLNIRTGVNKDDPDALLYSRLDELDTLSADGAYRFKFVDAAGPIVEWYQTSNPTTASDIEGYVPVAVPDPETFPDRAYNGDFGGIGLNDENKRNYALIDSSPHHTHWWMSLGNLQPWNGLIPGWAGSGTSRVELYVQSKNVCPREKGYCVKADESDQNSGVIKFNGVDGDDWRSQKTCLNLCKLHPGATGCEVVWDQDNRGCYVHTQEVAEGNRAENHFCWIFSRCE